MGPNSNNNLKKKNLYRYKQNEKHSFTNQNHVWCGCPKKWVQSQVLLKAVSKPVFSKFALNSKPFLLTQTYAEHQYEIHSSVSLRYLQGIPRAVRNSLKFSDLNRRVNSILFVYQSIWRSKINSGYHTLKHPWKSWPYKRMTKGYENVSCKMPVGEMFSWKRNMFSKHLETSGEGTRIKSMCLQMAELEKRDEQCVLVS